MNLAILSYTDQPVRVQMRDDAPWFCAADVCRCLEINNHRHAAAKLSSDEKGVVLSDTLGGKQELLFVNEPGLYRLIFRSDKASAAKFQHWVFHEVLPAIRKQGGYQAAAITPQAPSPASPAAISVFDYARRHKLDYSVAMKLARSVRVAHRAMFVRSRALTTVGGAETYSVELIDWVRGSMPKPVLTLAEAQHAEMRKLVAAWSESSLRRRDFQGVEGLCRLNGLFPMHISPNGYMTPSQKSRFGKLLTSLNGFEASGFRFDVVGRNQQRHYALIETK